MAGKLRRLWITLGVIALVVVAAAVAVRLVFTREKLMAIVIPRVERMVGARVTVGDIGIDFPFGFGVSIADLRFAKTLPDTTDLSFSSDRVTVRASLGSLLRRRPEITSASVERGALRLLNANRARDVGVRGLEARLSMKPEADIFALSVRAMVDSIVVSRPGGPAALALEKVGFDGELEGDRNLERVVVKESRLTWQDLVSASIAGEITALRTAPRLALAIEGEERPIAPLLAKIKTFRLAELSATPAPPPAASPQPPTEIAGGTAGFSARVEGLARQPLGMTIAFEAKVDGVSLKTGDLLSIGALEAQVKGSGNALAWQSLVPGPRKPVTLEQMTLSWQAIELEGTVRISDGSFTMPAAAKPDPATGWTPPPLRLAGLSAEAEIAGTDVKRLSGAFRVGGGAYTFDGSLRNVMPAAAELVLTARRLQESGVKKIDDLGPYLDRMVNAPVVEVRLEGSAFDARPFQKPADAAKDAAAAAAPAPAPGPAPSGNGAGGILLLKNTTFSAKLDSVVTRQAVLTAVEAKGAIRDGRMRIEPVSFAYAGGKGSATAKTDLRAPARVTSAIDFSLDGVEAGQALGPLLSIGNLVQGRFSVKSSANLVTGEGIDPLLTLTAAGSALSSKGAVDFSRFVQPLSTIQNFDVAPFQSFSFSDWVGNFRVKDGRFLTDDWKIASSSGAWDVRGSFGFDGTIDYRVHLVVPPDVQRRMKNIDAYKSALDLMRDAGGNLVLDIKVSGSARNPSASLDLTKARSKVQDKLLDGLKKKLLR